jgi:hypothetical protein
MTSGIVTTKVARALLPELKLQSLNLLYGHGQTGIDPVENLGKLRSWNGPKYATSAILADLDMGVVIDGTDKLIVLIEIEETTSKPKVLLGDAMAILLGSQVTFQGKHHLAVGPWTTLIILACNPSLSGQSRVAFLEKEVNQLKTKLTTPNAKIRHVVIECFQNEMDLEQKLRSHIQDAVAASGLSTVQLSSSSINDK